MTNTRESITAKLCSFARAYHSNFEKNKIFDDYLAYDIMGKEEYEAIGSLIYHNFDLSRIGEYHNFKHEKIQKMLQEYIIPIPLSRIRFAEDKLQQFAKTHGECQYVICGAGVDTFAFRNENPNIQVFEIDHPATQSYKLERIQELEWIIPHNVHYVPVDFEKDDMKIALVDSGFDINKKTFISILGVTYYLTLPVFEETIKNISELSMNDNIILFDYPDETTFTTNQEDPRAKNLAAVTASLGETMRHGYTFESLNQALHHHGFIIDEHMTPSKIQVTFFANRTDNLRAFHNVHFISAIYKK